MPLLALFLSALFVCVQATIYWQGAAVALSAAQEGARVAALERSTAAAGISASRQYMSRHSDLSGVITNGSRAAATATVTVSATTVSIVPGWNPRVTQTATMPVERLTS